MTVFQSTLPVGGATVKVRQITACCRFQSTLPVGGATNDRLPGGLWVAISIHAPRGGSDSKDAQFWVHIFGEGI